jgi:hypothetical protein
MGMAHAAELAQCQALAIGLQLLLALLMATALRQALRGGLMGLGHGTVALHVGACMGIQWGRRALG